MRLSVHDAHPDAVSVHFELPELTRSGAISVAFFGDYRSTRGVKASNALAR